MVSVVLDPDALQHATEAQKGNRKIVRLAVSQKGLTLRYAKEELKGDSKIVWQAVSHDGLALQYATEELKGDRKMAFRAVSRDGLALQYATEELKGDHELVFEAVSQNGLALQYAAEELKGDRKIVCRAVSRNGLALLYTTEQLKGDFHMVRAAYLQNPEVFPHGMPAFQGDGDAMQRVLQESPLPLVGLRVALLSGRECMGIFSVALHDRGFVLRHCAKQLDLDPEIVERSGTLVRGAKQVQQHLLPQFGCGCDGKASALRSCKEVQAANGSGFEV